MSKKKAQPAIPSGHSRLDSPRPIAWAQFLTRRRRWVWGSLAVLLGALYLSAASNQLGGSLGGDNAQYLLLAKALISGQGYVDLSRPDHAPHTKYPPLFPLLIAPLTLLGAHQLLAIHLLICALALTVPFTMAGWVRGQGHSQPAAWAVLLLVAFMPRLYQFLLHLLSDFPFLAFCCLALWRMAKAGPLSRPRDLGLILAATLAALFTRTAGIALAAALGIEFLRRADLRRLRWARIPWPVWFLVIVGLAFAGWGLRNRLASGTSITYLNEFLMRDANHPQWGYATPSELASRFAERAYYYLTFMAMQVSLGSIFLRGKETVQPGFMLLLAPIALGWASRLRRPDRSAEWFFLFSAGLVCGWWYPDSRFVLPLLPLASFYLLLGLWKLGAWIGKWSGRVSAAAVGRYAAGAVGLFILLHQIWLVADQIRVEHTARWEPAHPVQLSNGESWREPIINWAKSDLALETENSIQTSTRFLIIHRLAAERVPPNQVILSRKPSITAWFTGRPALNYLANVDAKTQWQFLRQNRVAYVLLAAFVPELKALFDDCPRCFQAVITCSDGAPGLYQIVNYPEAPAGLPAAP